MCSSISVFAQFSYSKYYHPYSNYNFDYLESYVVEKFEPTTTYAFEGTIMVQQVIRAGMTDDPIQVTLVDDKGDLVKSFLVFENLDGAFTPTCATYNAVTEEYCIAGIHTNGGLIKSWFLFLDEDANYISSAETGVYIDGITGSYENLMVTDICPMVGISSTGLGDFTYVGVAGNTLDPTPIGVSSSPGEQQVFVGYINSSTFFGPSRAINYNPVLPSTYPDFSLEGEFFPSRIIELPFSTTDGGFMLCGTASYGDIFFSRLHHDLTDNGTATKINAILPIPIFAGDLYFDSNEPAVWFAGSTFDGDEATFIYQKIIDLTNVGITLYPIVNPFTFNFAFGQMKVFSPYFCKVAKIMPTNDINIAAIASNLLETPYYQNLDNYSVPMLNKIDFSDAELDDFGQAPYTQDPDIHTYPRMFGNVGLGNYLDYLEYYNLWYPSHTAHHFSIAFAQDESYVLASTAYNNTTDPEKILLNRTIHNWEHDCNVAEEPLIELMLDYTANPLNPSSNTFTLSAGGISTSTNGITFDYNDCRDDDPFKPSLQLHQNNSSIVQMQNGILKTSVNRKDAKICLYNSVGSRIVEYPINGNEFEQDINHLASGFYLVEILNDKNSRTGIFKITK